jgi:anthranilate phosphoribosyltransferase
MSGEMRDMKALLAKVADGERLGESEAEVAFDILMSGDATPSQIGAFLMALRVRGETVEEITGAARVMRSKVLKIDAPEGAIDIVGTGGDGSGTYNISTASAIVTAAAGVPVAKHGNRALSSKSGSADVLREIGINVDADMELVKQALWEADICFLMAPRHHSAMRHVGPTRVELGTRTIFNLLGPLSNPSLVKRLAVGVFSARWVEPVAQVLGRLGVEKAWVFNGDDGTDELSVTGGSTVAELANGQVRTFRTTPQEAGLSQHSMEDLKGGEAAHNAEALRRLLGGEAGAYRDAVLMSTAAAFIVADKADNLADGVGLAAETIDSGAAAQTLDRLIAITNGY